MPEPMPESVNELIDAAECLVRESCVLEEHEGWLDVMDAVDLVRAAIKAVKAHYGVIE